MKHYLALVLMLCLLAGCGREPTPTPDAVATQIAVEEAAHATMTARAPASDTPMPTAVPTNLPVNTATPPPPADTPPPTRTPTNTPSPISAETASPMSSQSPTPGPTSTRTASPAPSRTPTPGLTSGTLIIDHRAVALFDQIPDSYLAAAAARRVLFFHASVGGTINDALNRLQSQNPKYNRANWTFEVWAGGNPGWENKLSQFQAEVAAHRAAYDDLGMKFCYVDADTYYAGGMVDPQAYISAMRELQGAYPAKNLVWWTIPATAGNHPMYKDWAMAAFNSQVRAAGGSARILFDLADIESDGGRCQFVNTEDGKTYEGLCAKWTDDGGHPNTAGADRLARAWWVMMARLAGWPGVGG